MSYSNTPSLPPSPYKGLTAFAERDAPFFFGRDSLQEIIIASLRSSRLTVIYGASGVGKSSLISAGIVYKLNQLARATADEDGKPRFVVAVFNSWRDDPVAGLAVCVREAILSAMDEYRIDLMPASTSLVETFRAWARQAGCELYIILDQIEEYFLYNPGEQGERTFANEFPHLIKTRDLGASFLVSIREDAYTKLGRFEDDIPNLFDNSIPVEHLSLEAAREAIEGPLDKYNRLYAAGRRRIGIEEKLADVVLEQVKTKNVLADDMGLGGLSGMSGGTDGGEKVETPYLQLVMLRLWEEDINKGGDMLRLSTLNGLSLDGLSGAQSIVREHLFSTMENLSEPEKEVAAQVLKHLVTPSRTKIAYSVSDLAEHLTQVENQNVSEQQITDVLEKLSSGSNRIMRSIKPRGPEGSARYEIRHDVLCPAVLEWRRQYLRAVRQREEREEAERLIEEQRQRAEQERKRAQEQALLAKVMRQRATLLLVMLVLAIVAAVIVVTMLTSIAEQEAKNNFIRELERAKRDAQFNKIILKKASTGDSLGKDLANAIDLFKERLEYYEGTSDRAGVVTTLHTLGGYYRLLAQRPRDENKETSGDYYKHQAESYSQSESYYKKAIDEVREYVGEDDPYLVSFINDLGVAYYEQGMFLDAEPLLSRAMTILEKVIAPDDSKLLLATENLAAIYNTLGKYEKAERLYDRALAIKVHSGDPLALVEGWTDLAHVYLKQERYDEAESYLNKARELLKRTQGDEQESGPILRGLAQLYRIKRDFAKAMSYLEQSEAISREFGDPIEIALDKNYIAEVYSDQGMFDKAEPLFDEALKELGQSFGIGYLLSAHTRYGLGVLYYKQNKYEKAEPLLKEALEIQEQYLGKDHPAVADTLMVYSDLLRDTGRERESADIKARAEAIRAGLHQ